MTCSRCHKDHTGKTRVCKTCLDKCKSYYARVRETRRAEFRETYQELKMMGLCIKCRTSTSDDGMAHCRHCLNANLASAQARRDKRRNSGKCTSCGNRHGAKTILCRTCLNRYKTYKTYSCKCGLTRFYGERMCALCATVGKVSRMIPIVLRTMRTRGWSSVYDIASEAKTTPRTVWRVLSRLRVINAVSRRMADDELTALWKLEVDG